MTRLVTAADPWSALIEPAPAMNDLLPACLGACVVAEDGPRGRPEVHEAGSPPARDRVLALVDWARAAPSGQVVAADLTDEGHRGTGRYALIAFVDERRRSALLFFRKRPARAPGAAGGTGAVIAAGRSSWATWERDLALDLAQVVGLAAERESRRAAELGTAVLRARKNRARIRAILSVLQDGLLLVDDTGHIEYANQQLCTQMSIDEAPEALIGLTAAQVKGKIAASYRDPAAAIARIEELVMLGKPCLGEEVPLANGRTLLRDFIPFSFGRGRTGRLWHHRDVTLMREAQQQLAEANRKLEALSLTDGLTGLANRRQFDQTLAKEWARCLRLGRPLAVIMIDVDLFKKFNDQYGHQGGDECLRMIAESVQNGARRASDLAARYGGEEFAIIAVDADLASAWTLAEVTRLSIRDRGMPHALAPAGIVTASAGVAAMVPSERAGAETLVRLADEALYRAKAAGGDRIEVARGDGTAAPKRG